MNSLPILLIQHFKMLTINDMRSGYDFRRSDTVCHLMIKLKWGSIRFTAQKSRMDKNWSETFSVQIILWTEYIQKLCWVFFLVVSNVASVFTAKDFHDDKKWTGLRDEMHFFLVQRFIIYSAAACVVYPKSLQNASRKRIFVNVTFGFHVWFACVRHINCHPFPLDISMNFDQY